MGLFTSQISTKKLVPMCRQLATTYDAGIPILRSFEILEEQQKDRRMRELFRTMHTDLQNGSTLGEAADQQSKYLPSFLIQLLASGERGGKLDIMLHDIADYFEDRLKMQREFVRLMTLPAIQVVAAWFLGTFALRLVGKLVGLFSAKSPGNFDFETFFLEYARFQGKAMGAFAAAFAISVLLSRAGLLGWVSGAVSTFIWPLSRVTRKFALARFFRSMSLLVGSGLPIIRCIESSAAVSANPYIEKDLLKAIPKVKDGHTLVEAFLESRYLTPTAREMLMVGEQSGQLEKQLHKVSEYMFSEARHAVQVMTKLFSTAIILAVALLIGYIVITFYMTLYGGLMDELGV